MRREFITKSTSGGCGQFETSPEEIEQEMLTALCERRQTDRLKTNYRVDGPCTHVCLCASVHACVHVWTRTCARVSNNVKCYFLLFKPHLSVFNGYYIAGPSQTDTQEEQCDRDEPDASLRTRGTASDDRQSHRRDQAVRGL